MNLDKDSLKKYLAELIGTFVLVVFGCGTAVVTQCSTDNYPGYILTAMAFGLVIVAMAYSIGNISGCHINPAVSLAMLVSKKMPAKDFLGYIIAQFVGGILGGATLMFVLGTENGLGCNGLYGGNFGASFVVEVILTFVFLIAILGVTSKPAFSANAGLVIGFSLTLVHLFGIGLTGTSVNPARSLGPALMMGGDALSQVWVFILAPLVGAVLAAVLYQFLSDSADVAEEVVTEEIAPVEETITEEISVDQMNDTTLAAVTEETTTPQTQEATAAPVTVSESSAQGTTIRTADLVVTLPAQTAFSVDTGSTKISVAAPADMPAEASEEEALAAIEEADEIESTIVEETPILEEVVEEVVEEVTEEADIEVVEETPAVEAVTEEIVEETIQETAETEVITSFAEATAKIQQEIEAEKAAADQLDV